MLLEPAERAALLDGVAARLEAERRGLIPPDFGFWITWARTDFFWDAAHFRVMQETLDRVTSGELTRVIFQLPIRHAKSEHNTLSYQTYRLERDPTDRLLMFSHNEKLSHKFSRSVRRLAENRGVVMSRDRNTAGEWETEAGGGMMALGAGAGTASLNADLITIDDPIGKREHAESEIKRDWLWDWLTNDVLSRTEYHTPVILTMSRWHMDDIVGRILDDRAGTGWHVVDLPGRAEEDDPLGRALNAPLWPEERGEDFLTQKYQELGPYGFNSLIQGRPHPREGGMFKWDWWQEMDAVPAVGPMVRYWDTAGTDATGENDPDYTVGVLMCRMPDNRTAIVDVVRFRHSLSARNARMLEVCRDDVRTYGNRVRWWIETETGIGGRERMTDMLRLFQNTGMAARADPRGQMLNKTLRAEPLAAKAEAGNISLCPGEWRSAFRFESIEFPGGNHDDQIDAAAGADAKLSNVNVVTVGTTRG